MNAVLFGVVVGASVIAVGFSCVAVACVLMAQMCDDLPDAGEADELRPVVSFPGGLDAYRENLARVERAVAFDRSAARARVRAAIDRAAEQRGWTVHDDEQLRELLDGAE